jgi:ribulose 1,5-bisphosphate carboxylase large subunit-like protein
MHGHPMGTRSGGIAMIQAINGEFENPEYKAAIEKWGDRKFSKDLAYRIF